MSIGQGSRGNHVAGAKEIVGRGDVVTSFVPVVRQAQQRQVRQVDAHEQQGEDQPQGQRGGRAVLFGKSATSPYSSRPAQTMCAVAGLEERLLRNAISGLDPEA